MLKRFVKQFKLCGFAADFINDAFLNNKFKIDLNLIVIQYTFGMDSGV